MLTGILLLFALGMAGMVSRENNFEFAQEPQISGPVNGVYTITFSTKAKCDATVAIIKGDLIVRHLASGVLGANAPYPYAKDALSQSLEWDGKDDVGNAAPEGCQVRVSLGLKASYAGEISDPYCFTTQGGSMFTTNGVTNMVCDTQGLLQVFTWGQIRSFDKDGKYVRTILPHPAAIIQKELPTSTNYSRWLYKLTTDGDKALDFEGMVRYFSLTRNIYSGNTGTIACLPSTNMLLVYTYESFLSVCATDGAISSRVYLDSYGLPLDPYHQGLMSNGILHLAVTPNEDSLYLAPDMDPDAAHVVYKASVASPNTKGALFAGEPNVAGSDNLHFNRVTGIAVDAGGNVYVSDNGNNRIQVFGGSGILLRTLRVTTPEKVFIHPVTGNLYCFAGYAGDSVLKLSPEGTVLAGYRYQTETDGMLTSAFCLDTRSDPPAVWVARQELLFGFPGYFFNPIIERLEDRGSSFVKTVTIARRSVELPDFATETMMYLSVDPVTDDLYLDDFRYNGNTLEIDAAWTKTRGGAGSQNVAFDRNGLVYFRTGALRPDEFIFRMDRSGNPVDFANGVVVESMITGGFEFLKGKNYKGIPTHDMINGADSPWKRGIDVAANGDIYIFTDYCTVGCQSLKVFDSLGNLKSADAAVRLGGFDKGTWGEYDGGSEFGLIQTLKVGRNGVLYYGVHNTNSSDAVRPFGLAEGGLDGRIGCLIKVGNDKGILPAVTFYTESHPDRPSGTSFFNFTQNGVNVPMWGDNVHWAFYGASGKTPGCRCDHEDFDMDRFERTFVPANQINSVVVLDANGNSILRVGRYGNAENRGPGSAEIGFCLIKTAAVSDKALYVLDYDNKRILKATLGYENEVLKNLDNSSAVSVANTALPAQAELYMSVPNPFTTTRGGVIPYFLPRESRVSLTIYDLSGRVIYKLVNNAVRGPGRHQELVRDGVIKSSRRLLLRAQGRAV